MSIKFKKATSLLVMAAMLVSNFTGIGLRASAEEAPEAAVMSAAPADSRVAYAKDLIISEYVEGSGNNKAIEIYNGTGKTVDLSKYNLGFVTYTLINNKTVRSFSSSGPSITFSKLLDPESTVEKPKPFNMNLESGKTLVLYNSQLENASKIPGLKSENSKISFNGDDQILLYNQDKIIDVFGLNNPSKDPKYQFATDWTYKRAPWAYEGAVAEFDPRSSENWIQMAKNDISDLGKHTTGLGVEETLAPVATTQNDIYHFANYESGSIAAEGQIVKFTSGTSGAAVQIAVYDDNDVKGSFENSNTYKIMKTTKLAVKSVRPGFAESTELIYEYFVDDPLKAPVSVKSVKDAYKDDNGDFKDDNGYNKILVTVTALNYNGYVFAQDETAGIGLKLPEGMNIKVGDVIRVIGRMSSDYGFMGMVISNPLLVSVIQDTSAVPKVVPKETTLDQVGPELQGQLVLLKNVKINAGPNFTNEFTPDTESDTIIKPSNPSWIETGTTYEVIKGVVYYSYGKYSVAPVVEDDVLEFEFGVRPIKSSIPEGLAEVPVMLTTSPSGVSIYYTLDGSTPNESSTKYTAPIVIEGLKILKAIGYKEGLHPSRVFTTELYNPRYEGVQLISSIQGDGHTSPFKYMSVTVEGVVTATAGDGFYVQSLTPDENPNTSEAIFVKKPADSNFKMPTVKNSVSVKGVVYEYAKDGGLSVTELRDVKASDVVIKGNVELPEPIILGEGGRIIPNKFIDNDKMESFDPEEDAIDFYESLEHMLIKVNNPLVTGNYSNKEFNILSDKGKYAEDRLTVYGGIKWTERSSNPDNLLVTNGLVNNTTKYKTLPNMGSEFDGAVTGVIGYKDNKFVLMNSITLPNLVSIEGESRFRKLVRETTGILFEENKLTVASYNIENFSVGDAEDRKRVSAVADTMISNLNTPDIIGILEIQDDSAEKNNRIVDASQTMKLLVDTINTKTNGATNYDFVQINPENNTDGGAPGANIRVGFIYKKNRVSLAPGKIGDSITGTKVVNGHMNLNPGRIIPTDASMFERTRKSLATEFIFKGQPVVVIANHFSSKSSSTPLYGSTQPPFDPAYASRTKQGTAVNAFIKELVKQNPTANVIALGDLNAYEFEEAAVNLAGKELVNLHYTLPENERFTYMFQGSSQVLDQMMVSKHLVNGSKFDAVHINAFFTEAQGSVSDHDPVLAQLTIPNIKIPRDPEDKPSKNTGTVTPSTPTPTQPVKPTVPATDNKAADAAKEKAKATGKLTEAEKAVLKEAIKEELKAQATSNKLEDRKQLKENIALLNKVLGNVEAKQELLANPEALSKAIATSVENLKKELVATGLSEKTAKPVVTLESTTEKISLSLQAADLKVAKANGADFKVATADASVKVANADLNADKAYKVAIEKDASLKGTAPKQMAAISEGVKLDTEFKTVQLAIPVDAAKAKTLGVFKLDEAKKTYVLVKSQMDAATGSLVVNDASNGQYVVAEVKTAFADTSKTWAKDTIAQVSARGIMVGLAEDKFAPEKTVTKAEFAAALLNVIGKADPNAKDWKTSSVAAANQLGFGANFLSDKTADKAITREEMAYMMAKAYALKAEFELQASTLNFKDAKNVNKALQGEVAKAQELGLVKGMADGNFKPASTGTRAEAAQMLLNLASNL